MDNNMDYMNVSFENKYGHYHEGRLYADGVIMKKSAVSDNYHVVDPDYYKNVRPVNNINNIDNGIITFDTSESGLDNLIDGLKRVHDNLSKDDRVKIRISPDTCRIIAYVEPRDGKQIEVIF